MILPDAISRSNSKDIASWAISENWESMAKLIEFSEEAWEIRITLISFLASAPKRRMEIPVTPTIPKPWIVNKEIPEMEEIPLIG